MTQPFVPVRFQIGELINKSWKTLIDNPALFIGGTIFFVVLMFLGDWASSKVIGCSGTVSIIITGPFGLGWAAVVLASLRKTPAPFSMLFSGFHRFVPAFLAALPVSLAGSVLPQLMLWLGLPAASTAVPGLLAAVLYFLFLLTFYYMADRHTGAVDALAASYRTVTANLGQWLLILLTLIGLAIAGFAACCVGIFVTMPLGMLVVGLAYLQAEGETV